MMDEAEKAALRFKPHARTELARAMNVSGLMYDSRSGLGGYYRYQPRKLSARMDLPDPTTLMMQDPIKAAHGRLRSVKVHGVSCSALKTAPTATRRSCFGPFRGDRRQVARCDVDTPRPGAGLERRLAAPGQPISSGRCSVSSY
jgi:hypothetical protein